MEVCEDTIGHGLPVVGAVNGGGSVCLVIEEGEVEFVEEEGGLETVRVVEEGEGGVVLLGEDGGKESYEKEEGCRGDVHVW